MQRRSKSGAIAVALGALSAIAFASAAQAAWIKAETDRFIVYGEGSEVSVRNYAVKLNAFDAVLRSYHPSVAAQPPGHKLEVYLVRGGAELRQVMPRQGGDTRGVYVTSADAIMAIVDTAAEMDGDVVLFHEYAHHFMHENFPAAYPAWFVEGWAEYFSTTRIRPQAITVGGYDENRMYWLARSGWLSLHELLSKRYGEVSKDKQVVYYSQAWLLVHYMRSDPARSGQLDKAIRAIADGENPVKAFRDATGLELSALADRLRSYQTLRIFNLTNPVKAPDVRVTALPPSADDLLLARARLNAMSEDERDDAFLAAVRARAARHPGDRFAELTLAHAEFLLGEVAAGEAVVQRLMASDPNDAEVIRLAGRGQVLAGERAPDERPKRFAAARALAGKAYQLDKRDYRILYQYAFARTIQPDFPTDNDIEALTQAYLLAPSVEEVAMTTGIALIAKGETAKAKRLLARIANNPHGGPLAAEAKALIEGREPGKAAVEEKLSLPRN